MSAREELINILSGGHESNKHAMGLVADMILAKHAAELAEKEPEVNRMMWNEDCPDCHGNGCEEVELATEWFWRHCKTCCPDGKIFEEEE